MFRATRGAIALAAISIACAASAPTAAPARSRGTLSAAEYRELSAATAQLSTSATSKSINWRRARAACRTMGTGTALLRSQRSSCLDGMSALEALAGFPSAQARCASAATHTTGTTTTSSTTTTGTTTAGTTTTPAQSTVIRMIICLSPRYHALARYGRALYRADIGARRQALLRGFSGACLATLASTPANLRKERAFASSTARLANDVTILIKVTTGHAPTSDLNQTQIDADVTRFESSARALLEERSPQKLSACPHR